MGLPLKFHYFESVHLKASLIRNSRDTYPAPISKRVLKVLLTGHVEMNQEGVSDDGTAKNSAPGQPAGCVDIISWN